MERIGGTLAGYADRLSVAPGETLRFMVTCEGATRYQADLVRVICGDINPAGPGFNEELVKSTLSGAYKGRRQRTYPGSFVRVRPSATLGQLTSFTLQAMVWPTTPGKGRQGILTKWSERTAAGFGLFIDDDGAAALVLGGGGKKVMNLSTAVPMRERHWYFVAASYDAASGGMSVYQEPLFRYPTDDAVAATRTTRSGFKGTDMPFLMAAWAERRDDGPAAAGGHFNGKIDRPRLAARALSRDEIEALKADRPSPRLGAAVMGLWDFARDMTGTKATDTSPHQLHGEAINLLARAMTGHNWSGETLDWRLAPEEYSAIHFHDDDLYDCGWKSDFSFTVPPRMRSGFYAVRLTAGQTEGRIAFFVRPPLDRANAPLAFLVSTASYLAYANFKPTPQRYTEVMTGRVSVMHPLNFALDAHPEWGASLYDLHSDGSGICYSSRLRPIINIQPKYIRFSGAHGSSLREYNADTHFIGWLEAMGHQYDVITDEDLHEEGVDLLRRYRAVMTCSHPEYTSKPMWDAIKAYTDGGGRLMYMGGNGFYWRVAFHAELPGVIEVRRAGPAVRAWADQPGESHHSFDGTPGGLWRNQGRAPQRLAGVGFIAQGFDLGAPYRRTAASHDPRVRFMFEGIADDGLIGDFGLEGGGVASIEIDRADHRLGTPPHALVVAVSEGHTESFLLVAEQINVMRPNVTAPDNDAVHADIVFYETPNGGAVFAVGSIGWQGSLSHEGYANNVAKLTDNVARRFVDEKPF